MYYSQKELKYFDLGILVIHGMLEHIVLNIFKYMFWHICTKIRKTIELFTKTFELYQVSQRFQYSQIVYIKLITQ